MMDSRTKFIDILSSTSSAPLYFKSYKFKRNGKDINKYIDGGIFANNPILIALNEY